MIPEVSIITPTGDRPEAFGLCAYYVQRMAEFYQQMGGGLVEWIVVDDGEAQSTPETLDLVTLPGTHLRPPWRAAAWENTLGKNLSLGLKHARGEFIAIVEDDDFYSERYLLEMLNGLIANKADVFGEARARYFNARDRRFRVFDNVVSCSLAQTVIRGAAARDCLRTVALCGASSIDGTFWGVAPELGLQVAGFSQTRFHVGMKGMPGRAGIAAGHGYEPNWTPDPHLKELYEWIGGDSVHYTSFAGHSLEGRA